MVHGENRIPNWVDRRLNGLAGPEYHAIISFGLPIEPEDCQYGEYRVIPLHVFYSPATTSYRWEHMNHATGLPTALEADRRQHAWLTSSQYC